MSAPIGSVGVAVVPDARDFWRRFEAQTTGGATEAGRTAGRDVMAGIKSEVDKGVKVKVNADMARATAEVAALNEEMSHLGSSSGGAEKAQFQLHALRDSILLLGPAAVPIAGVVGGAFIGLLPALAATALGIKGISDELKSGALDGTRYGQDITSLQGELSKLEATASGGLLSGIDAAMPSLTDAFGQLNGDVSAFSGVIGGIIAGAGPALVTILGQLEPLFQTMASAVADGADQLIHWAKSSSGISDFVAYVQSQLPAVGHILGNVVQIAGSLIQALAPMGSTIVAGLNVFTDAINAIPVDVLQVLVPTALSVYAAFRTFQLINPLVLRAATAITAFGKASEAASARATAAAAQTAAANATAAAEFAVAEAEKAQAAATSAAAITASAGELDSLFASEAAAASAASAEMTASFAGMSSLFATESEVIQAEAAATATALQTEADAAVASAAEITAAADVATAAAAEFGAAGTLSLAGMLGPIAAVAVGIGLLTAVFASNTKQAQANQQTIDSYTQSLQQNANALAGVNISQTAKNLKDQGALDLTDQLNASNKGLGITYGQLALAVNGSQSQFDTLITKLQGVAKANEVISNPGRAGGNYVKQYNDTGKAANELADKMTKLRGNLSAAEKVQQQYAEAQKQAQVAIDGGSTAVAAQARTLGATADNYLAAQQAAQKNTAQTRAQTLAFQLENDAASLLSQTLAGMAGNNLNIAQAETSLASSMHSVDGAFHKTGVTIKGTTAVAVAHQQAIQQNVQAAQQLAEAIAKQSHSSAAGVASLKDSQKALEANLAAHHKLTPAVQAYIEKLYNLQHIKVPPTKLDVDVAAAKKNTAGMQKAINEIRQGKIPELNAHTGEADAAMKALQTYMDDVRQHKVPSVQVRDEASGVLRAIQDHEDALRDKTITITTQNNSFTSVGKTSVKGFATGTGSAPDGWFAVGEQGPELARKAGPRLEIYSNPQSKAIISATGMQVPGFAKGTGSTPSIDVTIASKDIPAFAKSLAGTLSAAQAAFSTLLADVEKAGVKGSSAFVSRLKTENHDIDHAINDRARLRDKLHTLRQNMLSDMSAVKSGVTGSFDVTTAGADANGNVTAAGLQAQQAQALNRIRTFERDIKALENRNLNKPYLLELASKGPDALPEVQALLSMKSLTGINRTEAAISSAAGATARSVGGYEYGAQAAQYKSGIAADNRSLDRLAKAVVSQVADQLHLTVKVDGRTLATAYDEAKKRAARR